LVAGFEKSREARSQKPEFRIMNFYSSFPGLTGESRGFDYDGFFLDPPVTPGDDRRGSL